MTRAPAYLRPDVIIEPLVNQWYAWVYSIAPASAAMFLARSHVPLLESFIEAPQLHVAAQADPALAGGPFIGHPAARVDELRALLERTRRETTRLLALADAIAALDALLDEHATGFSLEPLYPRVPAPLRGLVELTYDRNHQANARLLEPLLYRSELYDPSLQGVSLSIAKGDARGYSLSTPRLEEPGRLLRRIPLASEQLDALYRMRHTPAAPEPMLERLGLATDDRRWSERLLTDVPPPRRPAPQATTPVFHYFGHASVLAETRDVSVLFDPIVAHATGASPPRLTHADLPARIDFVVLTHGHQDHLQLETLLELRHRVDTVVVPRAKGDCRFDPSLRLALRQLGFPRVIELDAMDVLELPGGRLRALPFLGEHADLDIRAKAGYALELGGVTALLLADSNNLEPALYDHLYDAIGSVELVFIGMECEGSQMSWLYGPLFTRPLLRKHDRSRRFSGSNAERALGIVHCFEPKQVYVYAMGQEPWLGHIMQMHYTATSLPIVESDALVAACRERGIVAERLYGVKRIEPLGVGAP